jgi:hypothetical protein
MFDRSGRCVRCNHSWKQHQRINYKLEEATATAFDSIVQAELVLRTNELVLLETAIEQLRRVGIEYRTEMKEVERALGKVASFLKSNAIVPYDDMLLKYLDGALIVSNNGDNNTLALATPKESRPNPKEFVETTQHSLELVQGELPNHTLSEDEVENFLEDLYNMRHFGGRVKGLSSVL